MTEMIRRYSDRVRYHITNFSIGMAIVLMITIAHNTYFEHEPPLDLEYTKLELRRIDVDHGFLVVHQTLKVQQTFHGKVSSYISKHPEGKPTFHIDDFDLVFEKGETETIRAVELPAHLPRGTWCLNSTFHWQPKFSLHEHSKKLKSICAELKN